MTIDSLLSRASAQGDGLALTPESSWLQGRSWFGGLQLALAVRAARQHVIDRPLRSIQTTFIAPVSAESAAVASATVLREGRSVTHLRAEIRQNDALCFDSVMVFGEARESAIRERRRVAADVDPAGLESMGHVEGLTPAFLQHYDQRWSIGSRPFSSVTDPAAQIYVRRRPTTPITESELVALADAIPSPALSLFSRPTMASSVTWSLELTRDLDKVVDGWLRFDVTLHDSHDGYAWHTAEVFDEDHQLVAVSRQCVAIFG